MILEGVKAKIYLKANPIPRNGRTYLELDQLKMDFSIKDIKMGVDNLHNSNAVIGMSIHFITLQLSPSHVIKLHTNNITKLYTFILLF